MNPRTLVAIAVGVTLLSGALAAQADLKAYVDKPDASYAFEVVSTEARDDLSVTSIRLHSQTWQGILWEHWLTVIRPATIKNGHGALLLVAGGNNGRPNPPGESDESRVLAQIARGTGSVVAALSQVPNQPLFEGRHEDAIIALTYDKYLKGEGEDWPLLLPMVKSAVRAMDTVQAVMKAEHGQDITDFMLTGASKRGWTTWLSAAVDPRIKAIAPIVIDVLNMGDQGVHQLKSYGTYSEEIEDYTRLDIQSRLTSEKGQQLLSVVDPFAYRDTLTLPKLIVNGANDPYWCVDSANLYFPELAGPKYLCYQANTGHDVSLGGIGTITQFYHNMLTGATMPEVTWDRKSDGRLSVAWKGEGGKATLWTARSENRDFRQSAWVAQPLAGAGAVEVPPQDPGAGYVAYYVEVTFPGTLMLPYGLTTQMSVLPDTFPHEVALKAAKAQ